MTALQSSTWHSLGLSVAASYTGLGLLQCFVPQTTAKILFDIPTTETTPSKKADVARANPDSTVVALVTPLMGARDLTIAAALFAFSREGKTREMGTLILAGTILCVADVLAVWKRKGAG